MARTYKKSVDIIKISENINKNFPIYDMIIDGNIVLKGMKKNDKSMVEGSGDLSNLSPQLYGQRWGWRRRSEGYYQ